MADPVDLQRIAEAEDRLWQALEELATLRAAASPSAAVARSPRATPLAGWLTSSELAQTFGISKQVARRLCIKHGRKIGGRWRCDPAKVVATGQEEPRAA